MRTDNVNAAMPSPPTRRHPVSPLIHALRPRQWTKNAILFAGLLFTLDVPHRWTDYVKACLAVAIFCLLSGCAYILNDLQDIEADRLHPRKRHRPIPAGHLPVTKARAFVFFAAPASLASAYLIAPAFFVTGLLYFAITIAYSFRLKNVVVLDVMIVAAGFVVRAVAGAAAIGVEPSVWLLLCTGLLALFLALNKRRSELVALGADTPTRAILAEYSVPLLDQMITIVAATCIMAYSLYTFYSETGRHRPYLMATIPFVLYGLFRYLYLSYRGNLGETPEMALIEDLPLRINVLLWIATVVLALLVRHG